MTLSLFYLFLGVTLLWYPRSWMRWGALPPKHRARRRKPRASAEDHRERLPGDESLWMAEEFLKRRNWIDLARGVAGGYAVIYWSTHGTEGMPRLLGLGVVAGITIIGLAVQTLRFEGRLAFYPPIFFLGGLSFGLVGWKVAFFAFIAMWAVNLALPSAAVFLFCYGGVVLILGVLFGAPRTQVVLAAGLALLPVLVSLLSRRRLMAQFGRKAKVIRR